MYLFQFLLCLFNFLLETGIYTDSWCRAFIFPVFKPGTKVDRGTDYRGICVTSCLGKVFCSLLNNRLTTHLHLNKAKRMRII